jgi:hypothetical protein
MTKKSSTRGNARGDEKRVADHNQTLDSLTSIMEQRQKVSPELKEKQRRLLDVLKGEKPPANQKPSTLSTEDDALLSTLGIAERDYAEQLMAENPLLTAKEAYGYARSRSAGNSGGNEVWAR